MAGRPLFAYTNRFTHQKRTGGTPVTPFVFGLSAIAFTGLIVFLINLNEWSPQQGDWPITILAFAYSLVALPLALFLLIRRSKAHLEKRIRTVITDVPASRTDAFQELESSEPSHASRLPEEISNNP